MEKILTILPIIIPFALLAITNLISMYIGVRFFIFQKDDDKISNWFFKYFLGNDIDLSKMDTVFLRTFFTKKMRNISLWIMLSIALIWIVESFAIICFGLHRK